LEEIKANQISQNQFDAKLEEMKSNQDQKFDDIKEKLDFVITEIKRLGTQDGNL